MEEKLLITVRAPRGRITTGQVQYLHKGKWQDKGGEVLLSTEANPWEFSLSPDEALKVWDGGPVDA